MNHIEAQKMIDERILISYEAPFEDLMEWVKSIYAAVGIRKSISNRIGVRLRYEKLHKQSIKNAVASGISVCPDVLKP